MPENRDRIALTEAVFYIMLSLYHQPLHGYGIMQRIDEMSSSRVSLGPGTLYGALNTLLDKQWIKSVNEERNSRKKEYIITDEGKRIMADEMKRLRELLGNGDTVMRSDTRIQPILRGGLNNEKDI